MRTRAHWAGFSAVMLLAFCCCATAQNPPEPLPAVPAYNPMRAVHDVEVGKFYMKRGDTDGAIERFKDAMLYKPNYAEPCLLLGQAYEKKNDSVQAVDYYKRYLKILPGAPESKRVRERIARLEEKIKKEKSGSP